MSRNPPKTISASGCGSPGDSWSSSQNGFFCPVSGAIWHSGLSECSQSVPRTEQGSFTSPGWTSGGSICSSCVIDQQSVTLGAAQLLSSAAFFFVLNCDIVFA